MLNYDFILYLIISLVICIQNATFTTNQEATVVVETLRGKELGGRKIRVNWALPIKDYKFKQDRDEVLNVKQNAGKRHKRGNFKNAKIETNDENGPHESFAYKKLKKWQSQRKNRIKRKQNIKKDKLLKLVAKTKMTDKDDDKDVDKDKSKDKDGDKEIDKEVENKKVRIIGKKRKQKWKKPATKKIRLPID